MTGPRLTACRSCGASIFFAESSTKRMVPIDAEPATNGNLAVYQRGDLFYCHKYGADDTIRRAPRRVSHFATCKNAAQHRKRGGSTKPIADELAGEKGKP